MIQVLNHSSQAIKNFPMGDPHERKLHVYLPPTYDPKRSEAYPVVFYLVGWGGRGSKLLYEDSVFSWNFETEVTKAILSKRIPEMIVVFPDGSSRLGSSQYINSPSLGNYMDYICDELVEFVDENFRTSASASERILMGHSSGGFGALQIAMERPEVFSIVNSSAGDCFFEVSLLPTLHSAMLELESAGGIQKFLDYFFAHPNPGSQGFRKINCLMVLSLAACYAPNPKEGPLFGELFFDTRTGKIVDEVWERYRQWDPLIKIEKYKENLKKLKLILLDCGLQDEYASQWGQRQLIDKLHNFGVKAENFEYKSGHSGNHWRFEERIKRMIPYLG